MKPVYFPFTYVSQTQLDLLCACFEKIVVYQPSPGAPPPEMSRWSDEGVLDLRVPGPVDSGRIEKAMADYRQWALEHHGTPLSFFSTLDGAVPFFDANSVFRIRSGIRDYSRDTPQNGETDDLIAARLFLAMAQAFDRHQGDVTRDLQSLIEAEKRLVDRLKGGDELNGESDQDLYLPMSPAGPAAAAEDAYMISQRLRSWALLCLQDPLLTGLLVNCSPPVLEELTEWITGVEKCGRIDAISTGPLSDDHLRWRRDLSKKLAEMTRHHHPEKLLPLPVPPPHKGGGQCASLSVFMIRDQSPQQVAGDLLKAPRGPDEMARNAEHRNTLVCLVTPEKSDQL